MCDQAIAQAGTGQGTYGNYRLVRATTNGGSGSQVVVGTPGGRQPLRGSGDDVLCGLGGNDVLDGGSGNDYVDGGAGDDTVQGGSGDDVVNGGRASTGPSVAAATTRSGTARSPMAAPASTRTRPSWTSSTPTGVRWRAARS